MVAMRSRKAADIAVPITPPMVWKSSSRSLKAAAVTATPIDASTTTVEWPSEKIEAGRERALALLHQLARHIVDGGDVVGVDRVAQPEAVGQERGAEQHRIVVERAQRPGPGRHVGGDQQRVDADDLAAQVRRRRH